MSLKPVSESLKYQELQESQQWQGLVKLGILEQFLRAVLMTGHIKGVKPVSALIMALAGGGKSAEIKQFRNNDGVVYTTEFSQYGFWNGDIMYDMILNRQLHHVLVPDLLTLVRRGKKGRESLLGFLRNVTEEGGTVPLTYAYMNPQVKPKMDAIRESLNGDPYPVGIVTSCTREAMQDGRHSWTRDGTLDRFLPWSYAYKMSTLEIVFQRLATRDQKEERMITLDFPDHLVEVGIESYYTEKIEKHSRLIAQNLSSTGFRFYSQTLGMMNGIALDRAIRVGDDLDNVQVIHNDFGAYLKMIDHMNYDFKTV